MRIAHLLAPASIGIVAACGSIDPSSDPGRYREQLQAVVAPVEDVKEGEPLSVERAMAMASGHDERLALSGEDFVQALIAKNRATAAFLPTLSFQPTFLIGERPAVNGDTGGGGLSGFTVARGGTMSRFDAPVVGNMNIFRGFGDVANVAQAEAVVAQRRDLLLDMQQTVLINVAQTYYSVLRAERTVEVVRNSLSVQQARLADVEHQLRDGLATRLSVSQTRAQVDATRDALVRAENDVRNGRTTLAFVIGVRAVPNPLHDTFAVPATLESAAEYERRATADRMDLRADEDALAAAKHGIDAAVAEYYPSVTLNVEAFVARELYADTSRWNALLSANLPIFSAGLIEADVRAAWSRLRQAALERNETRRSIVREVRTAVDNVDTTARRIVELEDEVRAAGDALHQAQDAVKAGLGINLDALIAQDQLLRAELDLAGARFDRTVFYLDLLRATAHRLEGLAPPK